MPSIDVIELQVLKSDNPASGFDFVSFRFRLENQVAEDVLDTKITTISVYNTSPGSGTATQFNTRVEVLAGQQSDWIVTDPYQISSSNTLEQVDLTFPIDNTGGANITSVISPEVLPYNPQITPDNVQLELNPTRTGYPIRQGYWFATAQMGLRSTYIKDYHLRQIDLIYDDATFISFPLPQDHVAPIDAVDDPTSYQDTYVEVEDRPLANGPGPLYVVQDKEVVAMRLTLSPTDVWEPIEVLIDPLAVQLNYQPMLIEATTSGNSIYINVSRGVAPYSYKWNDNSTEQNRINVAPGLYTVTVTDALGFKKSISVQLGSKHYFSANPVVLNVNVPDFEAKEFLRAVCEVYIERSYLSETYEKVFEAEHPLDSEGNTVFNMQAVLDSYLKPQLPGPTLQQLTDQFKRFYLRYYERYGDPEQSGDTVQVQVNYLLLGGLSDLENARGNFFGTYFANKPFYTWQPQIKEVYPDQPEYLTFIVNREPGGSADYDSFRVKVKVYDEDQQSEEHILFEQQNVIKYEPYIFPVGYEQLHLSGYSCKMIDRYEIWIEDANGFIQSEVRTYVLNYEVNRYKRYFLFQGSLGGWDTLVATGKAEEELSIESETIERYLRPDHTAGERRTRILSREAEPEVSLSIGYKSQDMMQALQDFLLSEEVYLLQPGRRAGETLTPVDIEARSATILDEDADLQSFGFSYKLPRFKKYTPQLTLPSSEFIPLEASAEITDQDVTLTVQGGKEPYTFFWKDADGGYSTLQNRTNLYNGTYSVIVKDSSSPRQAVSLCGIIIEGGQDPGTAPPPAWYFHENFAAQNDMYDQVAPGYLYTWPEATAVGQPANEKVMINSVDLLAGQNNITLSIYIPAGADVTAQATPTITAGNVYVTDLMLQDVNLSLRDQWQQLSVRMTSDINRRVLVRFGFRLMRNAVDSPTFYVSDFTLN